MSDDPKPIDFTKIIFYTLMVLVILIVVIVYVAVIVDAGRRSLASPTEPTISPQLTRLSCRRKRARNGPRSSPGRHDCHREVGFPSLRRRASKAPTVQALFALLYVLVLILALWYWWKDDFSAQTAEIIRTQAATLLGVGVGALAVVLNTKR